MKNEITKINTLACQKLKTALMQAASDIGIDITLGKINYDSKTFTIGQSKGSIRWTDDNVRVDAKFEEFKRYAAKKGVPVSLYGYSFIDSNGDIFVVSGIIPRGRKNTIEITRKNDSSVFVCSPTYIKGCIAYTQPKELNNE